MRSGSYLTHRTGDLTALPLCRPKAHNSDCALKPVFFVPDPIRGAPHVLVLCEVFEASGMAHPSNTRARLRTLAETYKDLEPWFGIEQEYTLFKNERPLGFPKDGFPAPQGPYYCGVGAEKIFGRGLIEDHMGVCIRAGLQICGINAEVMPGQWEFQIGPLGSLAVSDHMMVARWLLERLGENYGIAVSFSPKPVLGDWNGAGGSRKFFHQGHASAGRNRSRQRSLRETEIEAYRAYCRLRGREMDTRLTGKHETANINEFRYGVSDRGASIRIPMSTANNKSGYLEDRRPAANMDPYQVTARLIETVAG